MSSPGVVYVLNADNTVRVTLSDSEDEESKASEADDGSYVTPTGTNVFDFSSVELKDVPKRQRSCSVPAIAVPSNLAPSTAAHSKKRDSIGARFARKVSATPRPSIIQEMIPYDTEEAAEVVELWAANTSLHGCMELMTAKSTWLRVIWILILVAFFAIMTWYIYSLTSKYYSAPVVSDVKTAPMDHFPPSVIYCTIGAYTSKGLRGNRIDQRTFTYIQSFFEKFRRSQATGSFNDTDVIKYGRSFIGSQVTNAPAFEKLLRNITVDPNYLVLPPAAGSNVESATKMPTALGPCYELKLQMPTTKRITKEYFQFLVSQKPVEPYVRYVVSITKSLDSFYWLRFGDNEESSVIADLKSDVSVTATRRKLISKHLYPCEEESTGMSGTNCENACHDRLTICKYGCRWYRGKGTPDDHPLCNSVEIDTGTGPLSGRQCDNVSEKDVRQCLQRCQLHLPCDYWEYVTNVSPTRTIDLEPKLGNFSVNATIKSVIITVMSPYSSTFIEEEYGITGAQFISDLGGQLGLFFGASFLSFVQVVYFCCCLPAEQRRFLRRNRSIAAGLGLMGRSFKHDHDNHTDRAKQ